MLTTPNILKTFSENPYHVREYTCDQLLALLEQTGFTLCPVTSKNLINEVLTIYEVKQADC